ncbi:MAG TPA: glycoside hydrolase family 3 C-terminal domain-containing protein [Puia sp.]
MRSFGYWLLLFFFGISFAGNAQTYTYPFQNPALDVEKRIDNLLSLMTIPEKIACLGTNPSIPRLNVKGSGHIEGLHGVALGGPGGWGRRNPIPTTQFPQAIGLAETWDTAILRRAAAVEGYEARWVFQTQRYMRGGIVVRAPNSDLGRDPRWGRTEECYGEDPFFNGTMVTAFIRGLQGDDPKYWQTAALMKHFLANSNENGRDSSSSNFDNALLREYYSVPFRMGVENGGARAYMASYNAVNGIPMMVNPILRKLTIDEWGQNGIICTDGGALRLLYSAHKYYTDSAFAAAQAVKAGINQFLDRYRGSIEKALQDSLLTVADIDRSIRGVFRVMIHLGLLDPPSMVPYASIKEGEEPWLFGEHKALAREVTRKSIVLLKNENDLLPLDRSKLRTIAVIGPYADRVLLDWYSGTPPYAISPLEGIRNKAGIRIAVPYTTGYNADSVTQLARTSDVVILVVGNHPTCNAGWKQCPVASDGKEAVDRKSIYLEEEELIRQVRMINPRTVVVLVSSFPYAITWTEHNVPAILHMTHNSEESGNALADVLFGDYNPGGRLVQTWPSSMDQLPPMMDYNIRDGRTYMYFKGQPLFPFGYGLSYTHFRYSNFRAGAPKDGVVIISADIENTGSRTGDEVVQLYVREQGTGTAARPLPEKELKGFVRITLPPHEKKTVHIPLSIASLAHWEDDIHRWVNPEAPLQIMIGSSSADIRGELNLLKSNFVSQTVSGK